MGGWKLRPPPASSYLQVGDDAGVDDDVFNEAAHSKDVSEALSQEACDAAAKELGGYRGEALAQLSLALPVSLSMICNRVMSLTSVSPYPWTTKRGRLLATAPHSRALGCTLEHSAKAKASFIDLSPDHAATSPWARPK